MLRPDLYKLIKKKKYLPVFLLLLILLYGMDSHAQQIRLDNLKEQYNSKNMLRVNGGVSANTVFYNGNNASRDPFNWILAGNINFSFYNQFNLPFSFNLNNLGGNYTYPTMPNRLSIHPTYKWIAGHLGDVAMTFSPYTLGGHQFTGIGIDLTPENIPLKVSVMYGRLLKATGYHPDERLSVPTYKRMGYGAKVQYEQEKFMVGMNFFSAHDMENSLQYVPDSLGMFPQNNVAISWEAGLKVIKNLTLTAEYGLSMLTRDLRLPEGAAFFEKLFNQNLTTATYHAIRANITYLLKKNAFGFGYERVDPNYQSLGAYYFTNDLENFTFNYARPFLNDKLTLALNVGLQHDNLDNNKAEETQRFVGALNVNYTHSEQLNAGISYSNFQTYTNIKSQFDYINQMTNYDNLDTLDFTQLSQNANVNVNWNFGKGESKKHTLGFNLNFQEAADKQGGIIRTGGLSQFYNFAATYGLLFVPKSIQLTASANITYNTVAANDVLTYGPTLGANARLFKNNVTTGASLSYNVSTANGAWQNSIVNLRWNVGYRFFKKHNLSFVLIEQSRNTSARPTNNDFTATLTYAYNF